MTLVTGPASDEQTKRTAKARLVNMLPQQVGIVDRAANERQFLIQKNEDGMSGPSDVKKDEGAAPPPATVQDAAPPPPPAAPAAAAISLPAAAKQALSEGLAALLTQASEIATMIQGATVDDAAPVPGDLLAKIDQMSDALDVLADGYDPEMAMAMKSFGDNYKADANAGGGDGSATPQKDPPPLGTNYVEKGAAAGTPPADVKPAAPGDGPPMPRKTRKLIAKGRMSKLDEAYGTIGKGADMLKAVMAELKGEDKGPPGASVNPAPPKQQATEKSASGPQVVIDMAPIAKMLEPLVATVRQQGVQLDAIAKSAGTSRAAPPNENGGPPPATKKPAFRGGDFNRQIEEEEREERERTKAAGKQ